MIGYGRVQDTPEHASSKVADAARLRLPQVMALSTRGLTQLVKGQVGEVQVQQTRGVASILSYPVLFCSAGGAERSTTLRSVNAPSIHLSRRPCTNLCFAVIAVCVAYCV